MKRFFVNDRAALADHLRRLAALPGLTRLIPSHGDIVWENAGEVMQSTTAAL